jgi:hypothetical protein
MVILAHQAPRLQVVQVDLVMPAVLVVIWDSLELLAKRRQMRRVARVVAQEQQVL